MEVEDRYIFIPSSEATQIRVGAPWCAGWWRNATVEGFLCTCVKAKQILESAVSLADIWWSLLQSKVYSKTERKGKKRTKQNKKPQTSPREGSCKSCKTQKESKGKGWRHPGNNQEWRQQIRLRQSSGEEFSLLKWLYNPVPASWAGTFTHHSHQNRGKWEKCEEGLY